MRAALVVGVIAWTACGGSVTRPPAFDGGDVTEELAPGQCPSRVRAGELCAPGSPVCLADDRCNDCFCTSGVWVCETRGCGADAGLCPGARPVSGNVCAVAGTVCDYGVGCTGAHCVCAGGRWTCDTITCQDR